MKPLLRILTIGTVKDLFRYRSFLLLIFLLFLVDKLVHYDSADTFQKPGWHDITRSTDIFATYVFDHLPKTVSELFFRWQTWLILIGLFLLKQLISMWPSSDMRRMHRNERSGFGIIGALTALRGQQVAWDAIAVVCLCGVVGGWSLLWYLLFRWGWQCHPSGGWLWMLAALVFVATPLTLAGFSYSSKLAVLSKGTFGRKLALFFRLFTNGTLFFRSWTFYFIRQIIETIFVALLPMAIIFSISQSWLRVLLAGAVATPVYSFLKMASFKFFLFAYADVPEVRAEYHVYYEGLGRHRPGN